MPPQCLRQASLLGDFGGWEPPAVPVEGQSPASGGHRRSGRLWAAFLVSAPWPAWGTVPGLRVCCCQGDRPRGAPARLPSAPGHVQPVVGEAAGLQAGGGAARPLPSTVSAGPRRVCGGRGTTRTWPWVRPHPRYSLCWERAEVPRAPPQSCPPPPHPASLPGRVGLIGHTAGPPSRPAGPHLLLLPSGSD